MKRTRLINLLALIINLGIVGCFFAGIYFQFVANCISDPKQFANIPQKILEILPNFGFLTSIVCMFASFCMFFANIGNAKKMREHTPRWIFSLRYIAMGMACLTLFNLIATYAHSTSPDKMDLFLKGSNLYFNTCIPLASIGLFVFFEIEPKCRFKKNFGPLIVFAIYSATILVLMFIMIGKGDVASAAKFAPYPIYLVTPELIKLSSYTNLTVYTTISLLVIAGILSFFLPAFFWIINRVLSSLLIGYEYVEIDSFDNVVKPIHRPVTAKAKAIEEKKAKIEATIPNVYNVSVYDHKLRNWKVVMPKTHNIKIFATQQEALAFASKLANKDHGIVRVHTFLGRLKFSD